MNKKITKHIKNQDYVKVYIADDELITNFNGFIFEQNEKFILIGCAPDFNYDGLAVIRKSDISEIKHSDNEKFFKKIMDEEKISQLIAERRKSILFSLDSFSKMFMQLKEQNLPIIIECNYGNKDRFIIGPVKDVEEKKVKIRYFNSVGEFDFKPVVIKYKEITSIKIDDPYATTFFKYTFEVE